MKFRHTLPLLAIALSSICARAAGLNGIELGSQPTAEALKAQLGVYVPPPSGSPRHGAPIASGSYTGFMQLAGMSVQTFVYLDEAQRVQLITVTFQSPVYFDGFERELAAKYGPPMTRGEVTQQNAFGAQVQNVEEDWILADQTTVSVLKFIDFTHGQLRIESEAHKLASGRSVEGVPNARF
jgi:hypothetical protein